MVRYMIILDLEWNRGYDRTPLEEILQIGAVRLETLGGPIVDTFNIFIHPCVHKKLNQTAKALPELQSALDSPYDFPTALQQFSRWCSGDSVFADWGGDDFEVLRQNCAFWKLPAPPAAQLIDLQMAFSLRVGTNQGMALYRAVEYCGIPDSFTFHNALHDAVYTALVSAWITQDALALLALPKEIRRLRGAPVFPPQPEREAGPYASLQTALNSRGCRRPLCPLCGEAVWVRRWYSDHPDRYYSDFRCKTHGSFLCRLHLSPTESGQWQGRLSVPEITPALLRDFDHAIHTREIPCKSVKPRKEFRRRYHRRRPASGQKGG